ncbi:MAG: hypothetical protein ACJATE_001240 [Bacteroidia bacterium]|jgi:hypothetical protein
MKERRVYICNIIALITRKAKMKKVLFLGLLIASAGFVGCNEEEEDDDHDHNHVTITFDEPMNDEVIPLANADDVHIHIEFVFEEEGHGVEVKLHPEGDESDLIIDHDFHSHDMEITFTQEVDLSSYPPGTEFHLEAKGCEDHDCTESVTKDIHFELGQ